MTECTICLEPLEEEEEEEEKIYKLNCDHKYHTECIMRWLTTNPTCPLCRAPIDADQRYVDDGIITEERRQYIERLKGMCLIAAQGLELVFPQGLEGYTEQATRILESEQGEELLRKVGEDYKNLLLILGASCLMQYIMNRYGPR